MVSLTYNPCLSHELCIQLWHALCCSDYVTSSLWNNVMYLSIFFEFISQVLFEQWSNKRFEMLWCLCDVIVMIKSYTKHFLLNYKMCRQSHVTFTLYHIDGLVQEKHKFIVVTLELHLSCTNPSVYAHIYKMKDNEILFRDVDPTLLSILKLYSLI